MGEGIFNRREITHLGPSNNLDDRQITHLINVRLRHLLYDFLGGVLGLLPVVSLFKKRPKHPHERVI